MVSDTDRYDLGIRILTDFGQKQQRDLVDLPEYYGENFNIRAAFAVILIQPAKSYK